MPTFFLNINQTFTNMFDCRKTRKIKFKIYSWDYYFQHLFYAAQILLLKFNHFATNMCRSNPNMFHVFESILTQPLNILMGIKEIQSTTKKLGAVH